VTSETPKQAKSLISKLCQKVLQKKIFLAVLALVIGIVALGLSLTPPYVRQSATDQIASEGLQSYLKELGGDQPGSICWIGDPKQIFFRQFIGTSERFWDRFMQKRRIHLWTPEKTCLEGNFDVIIILFPFSQDVYKLPKDQSSLIQKEASEILSQTGRGLGFQRHHVSFQYQSGATLLIFSRGTKSELKAVQ
jgi:hypothetical protein